MSAYDRCVAKMAKRPGIYSPRGLCASIGRKKYGSEGMAKLAAAGRRNPAALKHDAEILIKHHAADSAEEYSRMPGRATVLKLGRKALQHVGLKRTDEPGLRLFEQEFSSKFTGRRNPANPADAAAAKYEEFHGRPAESEVEIETEVHEHEYLAGIGKLEKLVVISAEDGETEVELSGFKGALLSTNEHGTQLYVDGGDQSVDLEEFGFVEPYKEKVVLGEVQQVAYFTRKDHLGAEGGTATYVHTFGEEGGRLPTLLYSTRDELLEFAGGDYTMPAEGIRD